ncbi:cytochrome c oxidase, subunit VIb [Ramicandelaber brevisporus]|nr:cytochrome c oxidase, subunit VIb [Ramicandelaber brevisporus]
MSEFKLETPNFDSRFPNTNQTRRCWQNYVDYNRCINALGEGSDDCVGFLKTYKSLCPISWTDKWDSERDEGRSPFDLGAKKH